MASTGTSGRANRDFPMRYPDSLHAKLIAPCGMNCGLCSGHRRARSAADLFVYTRRIASTVVTPGAAVSTALRRLNAEATSAQWVCCGAGFIAQA